MMRFATRAGAVVLVLAASAGFVDTVAAQEDSPHLLLPPAVPAAPPALGPQDLHGLSGFGVKWISATKFTGLVLDAPPLIHENDFFFRSPGSATPSVYYASIDDVPNGAKIMTISCTFRDVSTTNNVTFALYKATQVFPGSEMVNGQRSTTLLGAVTTDGTPGIAIATIPLAHEETFTNMPVSPNLTQYYLRANVADDISFAGCHIVYRLQVSPAPATASFNDVPTTHPFFQVIEALKASGITLGCNATEFCPDLPVTRAAMAAFLARALGLFYPY